jgi:hypothetical protein
MTPDLLKVISAPMLENRVRRFRCLGNLGESPYGLGMSESDYSSV